MEKNINNAVFENFMKKNEYKINFENKKTVAGYLSFHRYSDLWVK